jgi:hypothetical protein
VGKILKNFGKTLGKLRNNLGQTLEKSWKNFRKILGNHRQNFDNVLTLEKILEFFWKTLIVGKPWKI